MSPPPADLADSPKVGMRGPRHPLVRARQALLEWLLPGLHYRLRRRFYSRSWERDDYYTPRQYWFLPPGVMPRLLKETVESKWLGRGGTLLDIGCGEGGIAEYLANAGYDVLGVDFAGASIARARSRVGRSRTLRFEELDFCEQVPDGAPFDAILDRGCYHGLPVGLRSAYLRALLASSRPGTRMLLMRRVTEDANLTDALRDASYGRALDEVRSFFGPHFTLDRTEPTWFNSRGDDDRRQALAGLVVWMTRR